MVAPLSFWHSFLHAHIISSNSRQRGKSGPAQVIAGAAVCACASIQVFGSSICHFTCSQRCSKQNRQCKLLLSITRLLQAPSNHEAMIPRVCHTACLLRGAHTSQAALLFAHDSQSPFVSQPVPLPPGRHTFQPVISSPAITRFLHSPTRHILLSSHAAPIPCNAERAAGM